MSPATVDNSVRDMGERLRAPFPAKDICWRIGSTTEDKDRGLALAYIDARAVQRRLDELFGWDGWRTEYHSLNGSGVICALSVRVDGDLWIGRRTHRLIGCFFIRKRDYRNCRQKHERRNSQPPIAEFATDVTVVTHCAQLVIVTGHACMNRRK